MKMSARYKEADGAEWNGSYNLIPYAKAFVPLTPRINVNAVHTCVKCRKRFKGDECPRCKKQE